jgi:hypothetical protein
MVSLSLSRFSIELFAIIGLEKREPAWEFLEGPMHRALFHRAEQPLTNAPY